MLARVSRALVARPAQAAVRGVSVVPHAYAGARTTPGANSSRLYVGNLSWSTKNEDLRELFGQFGEVEDAFVASDRETGRSRGFGFVVLDKQAADDAVTQLNETEFMGRTIRVNEAQPRPEGGRPPRSYGGEGGGRGYGRGDRNGGFRGERRERPRRREEDE